ncbi:MAG: DUF2225 domain-containing protein [Lachnospiraceae bacterium]|nr:DUF2225 domain-containing protein [Lachnospiraceae bacterium]
MRGQLPGSPPPSKDKNGEKGMNELDELDLLLDRNYICPVCDNELKVKDIRSGKARPNGMDMDLRPRFKNIDVLKYRVIECPACGYADLSKTFTNVMEKERKALLDKRIRYDQKMTSEEKYAREYSDAYRYYKSALRCCLIRGSKSSQRGFTALYAAWLLRGWREKLRKNDFVVTPADVMGIDEERKLIKYALRNLKDADMSEDYPINGMDEGTLQYLLAALCYMQDEMKDASNYVSRALRDKGLRPNIHLMAEELRDHIKDKRLAMKNMEPLE